MSVAFHVPNVVEVVLSEVHSQVFHEAGYGKQQRICGTVVCNVVGPLHIIGAKRRILGRLQDVVSGKDSTDG